jgi:hypothetical protein
MDRLPQVVRTVVQPTFRIDKRACLCLESSESQNCISPRPPSSLMALSTSPNSCSSSCPGCLICLVGQRTSVQEKMSKKTRSACRPCIVNLRPYNVNPYVFLVIALQDSQNPCCTTTNPSQDTGIWVERRSPLSTLVPYQNMYIAGCCPKDVHCSSTLNRSSACVWLCLHIYKRSVG